MPKRCARSGIYGGPAPGWSSWIDAEKVRKKWDLWGAGTRLVILDSPYRLLVEPLLEYIDKIDKSRQPGELITVVVPRFVAPSLANGVLPANTATCLRR